MTTILCAGIGIALIIPIASSINAYYLIRTREKQKNFRKQLRAPIMHM